MLRMTARACSGVLQPCSPVLGLRTRNSECWPPFQWMTSTISPAVSSMSATISVIRPAPIAGASASSFSMPSMPPRDHRASPVKIGMQIAGIGRVH